MKWKAYERYKSWDCSTPDEVPAHWTILPVRAVFYEVSDKGHPVLPGLSVSQAKGVVPQEFGEDYIDRSSENKDGYKRALKGDLVYNKMRMWQGAVGVAPQEGIVSPAYIVSRARRPLVPQYYEYLFRTPRYITESGRFSYGLCDDMNSLRAEHFKLINVTFPPVSEQHTIASFLDRETARIDALIAKKERQIELLNEKRAALISHAVTKGLDPNVKMKDSGVEWLGEIPEHWTVTRVKYVTTHIVDCLHATPVYSEEGAYPALRTADITPGNLDLENAKRVDQLEYEKRISRLKPLAGDIVYSREGERYGIAASIPRGRDVCLSQRTMMFRTQSQVCNPSYLMWQLNSTSVYRQAEQDVFGSTSPHVNVETIRNFWLSLPPVSEQTRIVNAIAQRTSSVDSLQRRLSRSIDILREYRIALISAAVTGKIDVREAA